jgi:hypothetical protein
LCFKNPVFENRKILKNHREVKWKRLRYARAFLCFVVWVFADLQKQAIGISLRCIFYKYRKTMKTQENKTILDNGPPFKIIVKQIKQKNMKTIKPLFKAALLFSVTLNAQITKGNWMVGGLGDFSSTKTTYIFDGIRNEQKRTVFNISPDIGYFLVDKFAIGTYAKFGYDDFGDLNTKTFGFGPFVRYYFLQPEKLVNVFAQANFGYNEGKSNNGGEYHVNDYGIKAGVVIFFNSSVGLEFALGYNTSTINSISTDNALKIGLGFQIHLKK